MPTNEATAPATEQSDWEKSGWSQLFDKETISMIGQAWLENAAAAKVNPPSHPNH